MPSNITTNITPDSPVALSANYQISAADRRKIDDQIVGMQRHLAQGLLRGQTRSFFKLAADSVSLAKGDLFCVAAVEVDETDANTAVRTVTRADSTALTASGVVLGIAATPASPGATFQGITDGIVGRAITGLASGAAGAVRATSARCERVASFGGSDYAVGFVDAVGNLTLSQTAAGAAVGGGAALATVAPPAVGTSNVLGASVKAAKEDHAHDHGAQTNQSHHATATTLTHGFMSATDKTAHDANTTYVNTRKPVVINVNEPNGSGVVLLGDGVTDETASIATLFAYAATLTASGGCVLAFKTGTYRGFNNTVVPQFCSIEGNGSTFIRIASAGCGNVINHEAPLNIGQPSDSYVRNVALKIEAVTESMARRLPSTAYSVGAIRRAANWRPALRGSCTLTFNAAAKTITRSSGSWFDEGFGAAVSVAITGTVSNNNASVAVASVTHTVLTLATVAADETIAANVTTGAYVEGNETTLVEPTSHCLRCVTAGTSNATYIPIGELTPLEQRPAIQLRGKATVDHQLKVKIITGGQIGTMTFQYALDGTAGSPTWSSTQTTVADVRGYEFAVPGIGDAAEPLTVFFPCRQASEYVAGAEHYPVPRVEVIGAPPSATALVDVVTKTWGPLGTMQFQVGWGRAATVDKYLAGGRVTLGSTQTSSAGAAYHDYAIPGTSMTLRFHAGVYLSPGTTTTGAGTVVTYTTPGQHYSIRVGSRITDGTCVWEVQPSAICQHFLAMGNIRCEDVSYDGGNFGPVFDQAENVKIFGFSFARAIGAAWFCANDGTISPGASGGYTNTVSIHGPGTVTTAAYGGAHDGGYTFNMSNCVTYQRAERGAIFIKGVTTFALGPGIYNEAAGIYARNVSCFSGLPGSFAFAGLKLDNVLLLGSSSVRAAIDIVASTASGLRMSSCRLTGATAGAVGLASVDDVHIDASNTHNTGGAIVDAPARARGMVIRNGVLETMPIATGYAIVAAAASIAFPTDVPKGIYNLSGVAAGVNTISTIAAGKDGQRVRVVHNTVNGILAFVHGASIKTRTGSTVYLRTPAGGGIAWAEFEYIGSAWYLLGHSRAYHEGQSGTTTLVAGVSPTISAYITANSVITAFVKSQNTAAATVQYAALPANIVVGAPGAGSFKISALTSAGDNTINTADVSTIYWTVLEPS